MSASGERCGGCGAAGAPGQRYCLECGERVGPRDPRLGELLRRSGAATATAAASGAPSVPGAPASAPGGPAGAAIAHAAPARRLAALPSWPVCALLVAVFLGSGVLLGNVAASPSGATLAAARRPVRLLLPATPAAAPGGQQSAAAAPAEAESAEPESAPPEPTPEPAPAAAATQEVSAPASPSPAAGSEANTPQPQATPRAPSAGTLPAIKHVFLIMLSQQPYASVFGPSSAAPYLARTLERRGELLARFYAVTHEQLANEIALVSGQGPTPQTAANCPLYEDITEAHAASNGQVGGQGCVYPAATQTLAGQLLAKHRIWRAYLEGMDEAGSSATACAHPAPGAPDPSAAAQTPPYATYRNPFVYFHSVIDSPACARGDVGLDRLGADLASAKKTPSFAYIVPDRCDDGSPSPCAPGAPAGLGAADGFLRRVVPRILASAAYRHGGLLIITVDEAPSSGELADSSSCCGQPRFAGLPAPAGPVPAAPGGGQVGALLLSPSLKGGGISQEPYNHFSLLRTIEDIFGLRHLGYAGAAGVSSLPSALFEQAGGS